MYKEASAITGLPSDGANYPVTTIIGDATVLAQTNATDTSFNATGLNGGTTYYFRLIPFGFNGLNNETYNYRTAATVQSTFCATVVAPEINIKGVIASNPSIPDNTTTTSGLNNTLFGSVVIGNTQSKVFRIENTGNADLIISNISFVGGNAADFSFLGISFPLNLGSASFFDFTVVFTPSVAGTLTTTININSNDSNEAVYDFVLKGTGTINSLVEINLKGNGSSIADNSIYPTGLNHTLFPVTNVGATFDRVFTIENLGSTNLNLTGTPIVTITGVAAGSFSVFVQPSSNTIAGGSSLTFTIRFSPTALGSKNATINILSNDGDESLYNFNISGNAKGINNVYVYGNGNDVLKGSTTTSTANNTNFGGVSITGGIKQNTFVIANYSTVAVYISNLVISGPNASMFSVSNLPINDALGAGNSTSFTINFSPTSVGFKNATLTFNVWLNSTLTTPDSIDPVVSFALSGLGNNFINCTKGPNQTIAQQDFEITPATPTWGFNAVGNDATEYHLITNGTAFGTGTGQNKFLGANSFQFKPLVAGTQRFSTIYLDPIDASLYKDVNFSMRVAPYCTTSNNGLDVNDFVNIEVSTDGGVNWTLEAQLNGFNNSRYEMLATGQKIFNTFYTGSNSGVSVNTKAVPSCIGTSCAGTKDSSGNYAFSQINLNNLPSIADLRIRIIVTSDNVTEIWAIDNIKIEGKIPVQATWTSTGWLPGGTAPTQSTKAVIDFLYDTSINGNIETCECEIKSGKTLEVKNSGYVEVQGDFLNYGTLNVSNNSSFVQLNDNALNIGTANNITRITSQFEKFDYIYWSSPVVGTTLNNNFNTWNKPYSFSFNTSTYLDLYSGLGYPQVAGVPDGFDDDGNVWSILGLTTPFVPAKGYIIMAPKTGSFPRTEVVLFSGEMNNGIKTFPLQLSQNTANNLDDYNLVGNPYPSAISADSFIKANIQPIATTNNITGTILFWTHKGDVQPFTTNPGPNIINYSSDDYAYYNLSGPVASGLGTASISGSLTPNGFIASGQGFFVEAETTNDLVFNNSMRSKTFDNSRFFRTANTSNVNNTTIQKDRIWLNLQNTDNMFSQQLIAYMPDTTLDFDYGYDNRYLPSFTYLGFYSYNYYPRGSQYQCDTSGA